MKRLLPQMKNNHSDLSTFKEHKWILNTIMVIGGAFIGAGVADCLMAINQLDLDQIARGLTVFSAGLTVVVLVDNTKTQKAAENIQLETQLQLRNIERQLEALSHAQQVTAEQLQEMKNCLTNQKTSS